MGAERELLPAIEGSPLALSVVEIEDGREHAIHDDERDSLLYVYAGSGSLALGADSHALHAGTAALVLAGEDASLGARSDGLAVVRATVVPHVDRHATLGPVEAVVRLEEGRRDRATGARSFQILLGPHNGSTLATMFAGFLPPGPAPWHYHLYDEMVWIPQGPGRLHLRDSETDLEAGSSFRLRPRQVHVVENTSPDREMMLIAAFAPAGSPSAAYLAE
jgi:quercetin dioxygenase-like cupin family protein